MLQRSALLTDLYEITMMQAYYLHGMDETAVLSARASDIDGVDDTVTKG